MTPLQAKVEALGGLIKTAELTAFGLGRARIAEATAAQEIQRIRQGWYANPWLPPAECQAARVGGQLACSSAAAALGLWEPRVESLHVCVEPDARALRSPTSHRTRLATHHAVEVHWTGLDPDGTRTIVSAARCIEQIASCESEEVALVVAESALNRRRIQPWQWERTLEALPRRVRRHLEHASAASESGTESIFVFRMARIGILVRQQVVILGVGRVDCLIGDRLIVELDSLAHHSDPTADRRRDALLSARGFRVLRFMYSQVMHSWPEVEAAVVAALSRGDHLAA